MITKNADYNFIECTEESQNTHNKRQKCGKAHRLQEGEGTKMGHSALNLLEEHDSPIVHLAEGHVLVEMEYMVVGLH